MRKDIVKKTIKFTAPKTPETPKNPIFEKSRFFLNYLIVPNNSKRDLSSKFGKRFSEPKTFEK